MKCTTEKRKRFHKKEKKDKNQKVSKNCKETYAFFIFHLKWNNAEHHGKFGMSAKAAEEPRMSRALIFRQYSFD